MISAYTNDLASGLDADACVPILIVVLAVVGGDYC